MQFWNEMEGKTVDGRFMLGTLLRTGGRSAWFNTRDHQQRPRVIVVTESLNDDDHLLKNLEAASRVHHPNVVAIETTGQSRIDDKPMVYAILEPTEENLGEVLRERALTPAETTQITESLVAGLSAIHAAGLFHGHVSAANVLASGDTVKLRSDCLQNVPADARAESFSQDTGDLGATVFESLTQRKLTSPQDAAIDKLPMPFRAIVKNAVSGSWGLAAIAAALKPGAAIPPVAVQAAKAEPKAQPAGAPIKPLAEKPVSPPPVPLRTTPVIPVAATLPITAKPASVATTIDPVEAAKGRVSAVRLVAIVALIAALGLIWYFYRTTSRASDSATPTAPAPETTTTQPVPNAASAPATPSAAIATTTAKPSSVRRPATIAPHPSGVETQQAPVTAAAAGSGQQVWRVVVYAYGRQEEAQQKADAIQVDHPELKPEAFSPNGHGPWLVTLGGPMSRSDAIHISNQVKSKGMPPDSYAQNFKH